MAETTPFDPRCFRFSSQFQLVVSPVDPELGIYETHLESDRHIYLVTSGTITLAHGAPVCMDLDLQPLFGPQDDSEPPRHIRVRTPRG